MTAAMHLTIATPTEVLLDAAPVTAVRAEDETGSFGVLPGHVDLLTVLPPSVLRWRGPDGGRGFCAIQGGVMTMTGGARVAVACRGGLIGDDLPMLAAEVARMRAARIDEDRKARVEQTRLHARAVRQLTLYLHPGAAAPLDGPAFAERGA
ncbi:MAG: F-type H+-transporting ATPase subunit epsilon [Paracoccaceae bacterium]|jgi:F-type H+-transporting ATPase subunit epsilon